MRRIILIVVVCLLAGNSYAGTIDVIDSIYTQYNENGSPIAWDGTNFWTKCWTDPNHANFYQYNLNGDLLASIADPHPTSNATLRALASDGSSLWSGSWINNQVYLYNIDFLGNVISIVPTQLPYIHGLTWDGAYLRAISGSTIYKIDANGNMIDSITANGLISQGWGLAYDGTSFVTDCLSYDTLYRVDANNGNVLDTIYHRSLSPGYVDVKYMGNDTYLLNHNNEGQSGIVDMAEIDWNTPSPPSPYEQPAPIPEPATMLLLPLGLVGLKLFRRKR